MAQFSARLSVLSAILTLVAQSSLRAEGYEDFPSPLAVTAGTAFVEASPDALTQPPSEAICPRCQCGTCVCPEEPAPCQPCPHVSTLLPYWNVNIFGALQANALFSTARPVAPGIPLFLAPGSAQPDNTVDIFARSSSLGALFTGPRVGEFQAGGMVLALFYNDALIVDRYGILPIQAWGDFKNEDWRFAAGLQFNVFCPNLPTMLTFSSLLASGNPGNNFVGQFRLERFLHPSDDSQWTFQAALCDPIATGVTTGAPISQIITGSPPIRITEDNGWPNIEVRAAYSIGELQQVGLEQKRELEAGVSVVGGQLRTAIPLNPNIVANTFGLATDFHWRMSDRFGLQGEAFVGQALGFANAGVLQSVNAFTFAPIRTRGAWGEVYYYLTPCVHTHWGAAVDDPLDQDLAASQITRNQTAFANVLWDITRSLRVGFEFTWRETDYVLLPDNQGAGFHTQVQWSF